MGAKSLMILVCLFLGLALGKLPEELEDLQTEFFLPYSVTEDVDFTIQRPVQWGCYQWSTDQHELVRLQPHLSNHAMMCGNRLEFQVLPKGPKEVNTIKIVAENVMPEQDDPELEIPATVEFTIQIRPVAKMEVLALKTDLVAGSDPVPFGISAFDAEDVEFDTVDGLQLKWFIGSKRDIAFFQNYGSTGPITKLVPTAAGSGQVIAVLSDPNYKSLDYAWIDFTVTNTYRFEPSTVYLMPYGKIELKVVEGDGNDTVPIGDDDLGLVLEVKDASVLRLDDKNGNLTALKEGETYVFLKNSEGDVLKGMPVWVTPAHSVNVTTHPHPESRQLFKNTDYEMQVDIYNEEGKKIYPSKNILSKVSYPGGLSVNKTESPFRSSVRTLQKGVNKVKVSLRSVLTGGEDDEEEEILPHIKGTFDFEVFDPIVVKTSFEHGMVVPWDDTTKEERHLKFKVDGGDGETYYWSVDNEEMARVDPIEGFVTVHNGPGEFKVRAAMPDSHHNYGEVKVHVLPPMKMEIVTENVQFSAPSEMQLAVQMKTLLPETGEEVIFEDCTNIDFDVQLSDEINFEVTRKANRNAGGNFVSCTHFTMRAHNPATSCEITLNYFEPISGRNLMAEKTIETHTNLESLHPVDHSGHGREMHLAYGSVTTAILRGGPLPLMDSPEAHFTKLEVANEDIISAERNVEKSEAVVSEQDDREYRDHHIIDVKCKDLGQTTFMYTVGNTETADIEHPFKESREIKVSCALPSKIAAIIQSDNMVVTKNKVLVDNTQEFDVVLTVKDDEGNTLENTDSIAFSADIVEGDSLAKLKGSQFVTPLIPSNGGTLPGKPTRTLVPTGEEGVVEIKVKLSGYRRDILMSRGLDKMPELPKVIDEDEDDEEEEEFQEQNHSLIDYVELKLVSPEEIQKHQQP